MARGGGTGWDTMMSWWITHSRSGSSRRSQHCRLIHAAFPALPEQQSCATDLRFCAAVSAGDLWPAARQLSPAPGDVKGKWGGKHENNRKSRRCRYKEINILQFIGILLSTGAHIYMHERIKADQLQVVLLAPPMKISSYKPHLKPKK